MPTESDSRKGFVDNPELEWGALWLPAQKRDSKQKGVLRILVIGSAFPGYLVLKDILAAEKRYGEKISVLGFVTDDPTDPEAKISIRKRMWSAYSPAERSDLWEMGRDHALSHGVPVFSGPVKTAVFRDLLRKWDPNVILLNGLGQKLDPFIFNYPSFGCYNFHPSDLRSGIGAGPNPYKEAVDRGLATSRMTVHIVSAEFDRGRIIGVSPPIFIRKSEGNYPPLLVLHDKICSLSGWMALVLLREILKNEAAGSAIKTLDFEGYAPEELKKDMMEVVGAATKREISKIYLVSVLDFSPIN